jgi:hypothetical protein
LPVVGGVPHLVHGKELQRRKIRRRLFEVQNRIVEARARGAPQDRREMLDADSMRLLQRLALCHLRFPAHPDRSLIIIRIVSTCLVVITSGCVSNDATTQS